MPFPAGAGRPRCWTPRATHPATRTWTAGAAELTFVELPHSITTGRRDGGISGPTLPNLLTCVSRSTADDALVREQIPQVVARYYRARCSTIVDVGGRHGTLLAAHPRCLTVVRHSARLGSTSTRTRSRTTPRPFTQPAAFWSSNRGRRAGTETIRHARDLRRPGVDPPLPGYQIMINGRVRRHDLDDPR